MDEAISPSGDKHPGEILHEDQVDGRIWTRKATDVPQVIAWVQLEGVWQPVVRIVITGTAEKRRITKFGENDLFLESTIQSPPPLSLPRQPLEEFPDDEEELPSLSEVE
jgi:hypothetical protein